MGRTENGMDDTGFFRGIACKAVLDRFSHPFSQDLEGGGEIRGTDGQGMAEAGSDTAFYPVLPSDAVFSMPETAGIARRLLVSFSWISRRQFPCHLAATGNYGEGQENQGRDCGCRKDGEPACTLPGYAGSL